MLRVIALLALVLTVFTVCARCDEEVAQNPAPADAAAPAVSEAAVAEPPAEAPSVESTSAVGPALAPAAPVIVTAREKVSYGIGLDIGRNFLRQAIDIDPEILARGIKDGISAATPLVPEKELQEALMAFQIEMQARQQEMAKTVGEKNVKEAAAFFAQNKDREGVVTLSSGLQYEVLTDGTGEIPKAADTVSVNYRGTLIDGTEFDSSARHDGPVTFGVSQVVPGWTEALQLMKVGSKWRIFVPADLAYGTRGAGGPIGPNAALIFELELLSIKDAAPAE